MLGFSPGFPYIGGLDPRLSVPRRMTPRTRIPAGTVAIARDQTRDLLLRDARRLEPDRTDAAAPVRSDGRASLPSAGRRPHPVRADHARAVRGLGSGRRLMSLHVLKPGALSQLQDLGRYGYQRFGVLVGGAMDEWSHRFANALVGNDGNEATLEITLTGPTLRFDDSADGRGVRRRPVAGGGRRRRHARLAAWQAGPRQSGQPAAVRGADSRRACLPGGSWRIRCRCGHGQPQHLCPGRLRRSSGPGAGEGRRAAGSLRAGAGAGAGAGVRIRECSVRQSRSNLDGARFADHRPRGGDRAGAGHPDHRRAALERLHRRRPPPPARIRIPDRGPVRPDGLSAAGPGAGEGPAESR